MARPKKTMLPPKPGKENLLVPVGTKTVNQVLAGMKGGETRSGFLGENLLHKPDFVVTENLDEAQRKQKKAIQNLLASVIIPNPLSSRSTLEQDKRAMVNKFNKSTLDELKRFLSSRLQGMVAEELAIVELTDEEKAEIQDIYKDISP